MAFSKLYQLTFKNAYYLALRITGNESDASKAVEESYKKAFYSISSLKTPGSFEAWIRHITSAKSIELVKKNNPSAFIGGAISSTNGIQNGYEFLPQGLDKSANAGKVINKIIDSLSAEQRTITMLHYFNEMPIGHIARMLGCAESNVESELASARGTIKNCVERMVNRETKVYPAEGQLVLSVILKASSQEQIVDETMLKGIFASATEGMFVKSPVVTEQPMVNASAETKTNYAEISASKNVLHGLLDKFKSTTAKQKIIAAVCVTMAVLIVAGSIVIPKISRNGGEDSTNKIDYEMLEKLKPYEKEYENLLSLFAEAIREDDEFFDGGFNFVYFNDNDIPDMTIDYKGYYNGKEDYYYESYVIIDASEEVFGANLLGTWFGPEGHYIVSNIKNQGGKQTEAYYKYKYEGENNPEVFAGGITYDKVMEDEGIYKEYWSYMPDAESDILNLSSQDEYNQNKDILLESFNRILSSYDILDFADSGKSLIKYLKNAKTSSVILEKNNKNETTTVKETTKKSNDKIVVKNAVEATYDDWNNLKTDLRTILTFCGEYNSRSGDAYEVVLPEYCTPMIYNLYFDSETECKYGDDPLGYFKNSEYYVFDGEEIDWIITNVFNQTPNHNLKTSDRYYHNGKYYAIFYPSSCPIVELSIIGTGSHSDDGYTVILSKTIYEGEGYGTEDESSCKYTVTIQTELKEINGKKVWSYNYITTKDMQTSTIAETTAKEQADNWKTAYNKYLKTVYDDCVAEGDYVDMMSFGFGYINNDDIPELLIAEGTAQASMVRVSTYVDGKVVEVGRYGSVGSFEYIEKGCFIASSRYGHGNHSGVLYEMYDDGTSEEVFSFFTTLPSDDGSYTCEINDQKVSSDEFEESFGENWPDSSRLTSSNTSYAFTYDDFDKYCS